MATELQYDRAKLGGNVVCTAKVTMTMVAGAAVAANIATIPTGSTITGLRVINPTAFTGTPTNINLTAGSANSGTQYLAATDLKAAGYFISQGGGLSFATANLADFVSWPTGGVFYFNLAAVGGTNPAGALTVLVEYQEPGVY